MCVYIYKYTYIYIPFYYGNFQIPIIKHICVCVYTKYVCIYLKSSIIKSYFNGIFMEIMENFKYICIYLKVYVYI